MRALFLILFLLVSCKPVLDEKGSVIGVEFEEVENVVDSEVESLEVRLDNMIAEIRKNPEKTSDLAEEYNLMSEEYNEQQIDEEYELIISPYFDNVIYQPSTRFWIPTDERNRHYKQYLEWIDEGNQPRRKYEKCNV